MKKNKGLFIGLSLLSLLILTAGLVVLYWLISPRLLDVGRWLKFTGIGLGDRWLEIAGIGLGGLFLLTVSGGLTLIIISALTEYDLLFPHGKKQVTVKVLFPINLFLARLFGISSEKIGESYVAMNNALVRATRRRLDPSRILVLLPHCLQLHDCPHRVTTDIRNCRQCGRCCLAGLARIAADTGIPIAVATGGTLARRLIGEMRPTSILAVACERDLVSGIHDAYPIPVYGILNQRPSGPCRDTLVDMGEVSEGLSVLLKRTVTWAPGPQP